MQFIAAAQDPGCVILQYARFVIMCKTIVTPNEPNYSPYSPFPVALGLLATDGHDEIRLTRPLQRGAVESAVSYGGKWGLDGRVCVVPKSAPSAYRQYGTSACSFSSRRGFVRSQPGCARNATGVNMSARRPFLLT